MNREILWIVLSVTKLILFISFSIKLCGKGNKGIDQGCEKRKVWIKEEFFIYIWYICFYPANPLYSLVIVSSFKLSG